MTLQERQKREIETLKELIKETEKNLLFHQNSMNMLYDDSVALYEALNAVENAPDEYFENIDKEE